MTDRIPLDHLTSDQYDQLCDRLANLERQLADYENRIIWHSTCESCARTLDSAIRETERAERAEAAIARVRTLAEQWQASVRPGEPHPAAAAILAALNQPESAAATEATEHPA
ncbi:hypothetical protein GCM10018980_51490 [Streptomyces capoamus]|uniref:Uncharacterized protein n=1 Tax=Streptomyces capoamus TaxID=68183 RepID=A0A919EZQ1_9ACTN|nr:hypothetical protein [Streptomyces capoamus]GGW15801.1 hypothetical protein GCM10010501_29320 [Streptomyces libani subsp. rufus]GHG61944.1 hypothetical protein GCM10018980_51490 [Streptomyces capoamus]